MYGGEYRNISEQLHDDLRKEVVQEEQETVE